MWISAAFERWQPGMASLVPLSAYAVDPSASTFAELPFVLPAQRPASPEIAESPTATTAAVPEFGPSARAAVAPAPTHVAPAASSAIRILFMSGGLLEPDESCK